ncbi:hypothetical protein G5S52_17440 [Grimontia sp. S25]|uniref:Uncharacterized protein n=1 Tax=Grimontia sedimenti TaxID=2711294 RepID=A0A6M1RGH9_9GAMM|nr:hypothetical protein [Grimontia sedimenti]NGN99366.1 hypothetical protein [Grimontia sedimenti]
MKFSRIYKETRLIWKRSIDISDGELFEDDSGMFPSLSSAWNEAEEQTQNWSEWHQLMVWCVFCGYHKLARVAFENGKTSISFDDIDKNYVQSRYKENLFSNDAGYGRQMRRAYINDLKP